MNTHLDKKTLEKIYGHISPFEFKNKLIDLAKSNKNKFNDTILDAGRGNPNWTAATPRQAFFTFGQFAVLETQRTWKKDDLAGMPEKEGIYNRLIDFLNKNTTLPGVDLIKDIIDYGISTLNFDADNWVFELTDGIIGDNYPYPDRILVHVEKIIHNYLMKELCNNNHFHSKFNTFAVEGGTAAMCCIFDSLTANNLLNPGDKIALMTPIFTPYLEIPHLPKYNFDVITIKATETYDNGNLTCHYPLKELNKLKDTSIKAVFVVNPNNPLSIALNNECTNVLIDIVKNHNPNLMIITDDVYCTFVEEFHSLISQLPFNTIAVYSLSKYFGVTGWRLGAILINEINVFDKLISELPKHHKKKLHTRYESLSSDCEKICFMDRLVADSRQVVLNHTAGLSTPQQIQMTFFCAFSLMDKNNNYKHLTMSICKKRKRLLFEGLQLRLIDDPNDASYYTEFNILQWAKYSYGDDFSMYIKNNYTPLDILYTLAKNYSVILLNGDGFASSQWSFRISLANLNDNSYYIIGKAIKEILEKLLKNWQNSNKSIELEPCI